MKEGLREINELTGIWGGLVCNNQGEIIQSNTPPGLDISSLENINRDLISMFSSAAESMQGISEIVLHYEQRKLLVLDLENAFLIVICTPSVDLSILRMTVNVVLTTWESNRKVQKLLKDSFVERI